MQKFNEWLKDKKNLPIVVGIAAVAFIAAGGLIAMEMGLFSGGDSGQIVKMQGPLPPGQTPPATASSAPDANPPIVKMQGPAVGTPGAQAPVMGAAPGPIGTSAPAPAGSKTAAVPTAPAIVNPAAGPDPFSIPGGQKTLAKRLIALAGKSGKPAIRDMLPAFNLFKLPLPTPLVVDHGPPINHVGPPPGLRVIGIVNAADGIYAILDVSGQSQTVKPGDSLQDGSKVSGIQSTSVTFVSAGGSTYTVPLTGGTDQTDQSQNVPDNNGGQGFNL